MTSEMNRISCQIATTEEHIRTSTITCNICFVQKHGIGKNFILNANDRQAHIIFSGGVVRIGSVILFEGDLLDKPPRVQLPGHTERYPSLIGATELDSKGITSESNGALPLRDEVSRDQSFVFETHS